jgi:hypothetical protein
MEKGIALFLKEVCSGRSKTFRTSGGKAANDSGRQSRKRLGGKAANSSGHRRERLGDIAANGSEGIAANRSGGEGHLLNR